jgi:hypothetical protein
MSTGALAYIPASCKSRGASGLALHVDAIRSPITTQCHRRHAGPNAWACGCASTPPCKTVPSNTRTNRLADGTLNQCQGLSSRFRARGRAGFSCSSPCFELALALVALALVTLASQASEDRRMWRKRLEQAYASDAEEIAPAPCSLCDSRL